MSVHTSSLLPTTEVIAMILEKYQVESEANQFALYVVKENGGKMDEKVIINSREPIASNSKSDKSYKSRKITNLTSLTNLGNHKFYKA